MSQISVIICSHDPRPEYFQRTVDGLHRQTLPKSEWELLVIDSASTKHLADELDLSWHPNARHVREDAKGKMAAMLRGIREARAELLVFVDDDNVLDATYLERALAILDRHVYLGAFGAGKIFPEFEVPRPPELASRDFVLALRNVPSSLWSNNLEGFKCLPWGAGICVTRQVADLYQRLVEKLDVNTIIGPQAERLFRGDDDLFSRAAVLAGSGFGLFPELQITHLIPAKRLNQAYFLRHIHDHAFSHGVLNRLLGLPESRRMNVARYLRLILHGIRNGRFSARCQWAAAKGEDSAARFTARNHLRPVDLTNLVGSVSHHD